MIVLSFNGFSNAATYFDAYLGRRGRDKHRLIGYDAAAAIFKDVIWVAAEEERFNRIKKTSDFPRNAINYCLKESGVTYEFAELRHDPVTDQTEETVMNQFQHSKAGELWQVLTKPGSGYYAEADDKGKNSRPCLRPALSCLT